MTRRPFISRSLHTRPAFTLVEVMFAVITLGIGLIMLAAIFPVAISQRKLTSEETNASAIATQAMNILNQMNSFADLPPTSTAYYNTGVNNALGNPIYAAYPGVFKSFRDPQTSGTIGTNAYIDVRGNLILPSDPRLAWIPLYRRDGIATPNPVTLGTDTYTYSSTAQVIMVAVQCRNFSTFVSSDYSPTIVANIANLQALPVKVSIQNNDPSADTIQLTKSGSTDYTPAGVQGAYVIIANDGLASPMGPSVPTPGLPAGNGGRLNGRIYKLGVRRSDLDPNANTFTYELVPGGDFDNEPKLSNQMTLITSLGTAGTPDVDAFLIGRGMVDPADPTKGYDGPAMPIAVYTGYITIH